MTIRKAFGHTIVIVRNGLYDVEICYVYLVYPGKTITRFTM